MRKLVLLGLLVTVLTACSQINPELKGFNRLSHTDYLEAYTSLTDEEHVLMNISFQEMIKKLGSESFILYLGGSWCPFCRGMMPYINESAKSAGLKVYNFDPRIKDEKTSQNDIRKCNNDNQTALYKELLEALDYIGHSDTDTNELPYIYVPAVIAIKDGVALQYVYSIENAVWDDEKNIDEQFFALEYRLSLAELIGLI